MTKSNLFAGLSFLTVCLMGAGIVYITDNHCDAILGYQNSTYFGIIEWVEGIAWLILNSIIGITLFLLFRWVWKSRDFPNYPALKIICFALLPIVVFNHQFLRIPRNLRNSEIHASICTKSTGDGMTTSSANLNMSEYEYLQGELSRLPDLPASASGIDITYYADNFFGEYVLTVRFECASHEPLPLNDRHWQLENSDQDDGRKAVSYFDNGD